MKKIIHTLILAMLFFAVAGAGCLSADVGDESNGTNNSSNMTNDTTNNTTNNTVVNDTIPH